LQFRIVQLVHITWKRRGKSNYSIVMGSRNVHGLDNLYRTLPDSNAFFIPLPLLPLVETRQRKQTKRYCEK